MEYLNENEIWGRYNLYISDIQTMKWLEEKLQVEAF